MCRFDFPKLPSNKTLVAKPVPKDNPDRKMILEKSRDIKEKVKARLTEQFVKDIDEIQIFAGNNGGSRESSEFEFVNANVSGRTTSQVSPGQSCQRVIQNGNVDTNYAPFPKNVQSIC